MKSFKFIIFILVIFLKTGNVLSERALFNVNNIEISGNLSKNNQFFSDEAIKKGFDELMNKLLLKKDIIKIQNLDLEKIKDLVLYYQISSTTEDRKINKITKKYNIFFNKEKIHNLFYNSEISYSDIIQYEIFFLPIHKKKEKLYVYSQNYFYENWNKIENNELIEFILPLEKIEILQSINNYKDNLFDLNVKDIFKEYSKKNSVLVIIEENNLGKNKIFLKTNIMGKNINKSIAFKNIEKNNSSFYDNLITKVKDEIVSLVKSQNLIDIRTPSFINIKFSLNKKII